MPRQTNASRILDEARERMQKAKSNAEEIEASLRIANAAVQAHEEAYYALSRALTPKPRKKSEPKSAAPKQAEPKEAKPAKVPMCGVCHQPEHHENHDTRYLSSHPFDPPKSVQRAGRKSSRKGAAEDSPAGSGIEKETVSDVQSVAAGG